MKDITNKEIQGYKSQTVLIQKQQSFGGVWIFSSKTQSEIIGNFLHLSLSTRRPAHSVERAVLTDNTRILPIASLQCKTQ